MRAAAVVSLILLGVHPVRAQKLDGIPLDSPEAERLRLDSVFDGKKPEGRPFDWGCPDKPADLPAQDGVFRSFGAAELKLDQPCGMDQAGVLAREPLLAPSPFLNFHRGFEADGPVEASLKVQVGMIGLRARLFSDDAPQLDSQVDSAVNQLQTIGGSLGLTGSQLSALKSDLAYSTDYQTSWLLIASALGQVGKSFRLSGPFDLGLVAGGLARWSGDFPNAVLDQSAVIRARLPAGLSLGLFGGVTEALGFLSQNFWSDSLAAGKGVLDVQPQAAPHLSLEAWGPLPLEGSRFTVGGGEQFNPQTYVSDAHVAASMPFFSGAVSLAGRIENESGPQAEFSRTRESAELGVSPFSWLQAYGGIAQDDVALGNASMHSQSVQVGLRGGTEGPDGTGVSLELATARDQLQVPAAGRIQVLDAASGLASALGAFQAFRDNPTESSWTNLRNAYNSLDPTLKQGLEADIQAQSPGFPPVSQILDIDPLPQALVPGVLAKLESEVGRLQSKTGIDADAITPAQFAELAAILGNPELYERALIRFARHFVLEELAAKKVDILGMKVYLNAPLVLALAHAYSLGLDPPPALTEVQARGALDPYLLNKVESLSPQCSGSGSAQSFTNCVLGLLPSGQATALQQAAGPQLTSWLQQAISWHSDLLRTEINQTLLQVFLAAEPLNELTVDRGVRIGELDKQWLAGSLQRLDRREKQALEDIVGKARRDLEQDLKAREASLRERLTEYGERRLEALRSEGLDVQVGSEDLAPLLAFYGDGLEKFVRDVGALGRPLKVGFNPVPEFGVIIQSDADSLSVRLPPVRDSSESGARLNTVLNAVRNPR